MTLDVLETFSVHQYQNRPTVNRYSSAVYQKTEVRNLSDVEMNEAIHQAVLMQSYLKKHTIRKKITVYRSEPDRVVDRFKDIGDILTETSFMSTSKSKKRELLGPAELTAPKKCPRKITIKLQKSGGDISRFNPVFQNQQKVLVPFGTKFKVLSRRKEKVNGVGLTKNEIEEVG